MIYHCCDELRRNRVLKDSAILNGIDYLEVLDQDAPAGSPRQRTLLVRLLRPVPAGFQVQQVRIDGGERIRNIDVLWVAAASEPPAEATAAESAFFASLPAADHVLVVRTERYGDYSPYRLRLVRSPSDETPPQNFDPRLASIDFSFKVECGSDFDCETPTVCPEAQTEGPVIDYLAKDYPSFRRLILDRLSHLIPGWRERSAADLGVTLAELIAYTADQLSYQQDAIATEAYLSTARLRTSLRRHALLVDYLMHDGCNARVWLHLTTKADGVTVPTPGATDFRFYSRLPGLPARISPGSRDDTQALRAGPVVFEPLHQIVLYTAHNRMPFYTWGDRRCCLPKGATSATLTGHLDKLAPGAVLLFEEVMGPATGDPADADPTHRHVLRLTSVRSVSPDDPLSPLTDPLTAELITEIAWDEEDALPFPLCVSSLADEAHGGIYLDHVGIARGNMLLADQGLTGAVDEQLGTVPHAAGISLPATKNGNRCRNEEATASPPRFGPALANTPLTFAGSVFKTTLTAGAARTDRLAFDPDASAAATTVWRLEDALPAIVLQSTSESLPAVLWAARRNLLNSGPEDHHFVVEVEHDGSTRLRFGDGVHGRRPFPGSVFTARYRTGNGMAGNLGADTIVHVVGNDADVLAVRNPLPAVGGTEPEDSATVRRRAPQAFRRQERAVTPEDYSALTQSYPGIQRAAATLRWTGSWHTVYITVDRQGGVPLDADFEERLTKHIEPYRMAGQDTEFNDPIYVSLEIDLLVCVRSDYFRADVRNGLLEVLGSRVLADGRQGFFHPDRLSFGQVVYLGQLYAAARQVAGVASVQATVFQRQGIEDPGYLADGFMRLSRLEIPRLDNDRNFPEHGVLRLSLYGGK